MNNREWTLTYGICAEVEVDTVILNVWFQLCDKNIAICVHLKIFHCSHHYCNIDP